MMPLSNPYTPVKGRIIHCVQFPFEIKLFRVEASLEFTPGQFVEISLPGVGEFPVSITSPPHERGWFEIGIKKVGRVTSYAFSLGTGDCMNYRGPFGTGFPLEKMRGKRVVLVAGGLGILPLRSFIKEVLHTRWCESLTILYGMKSPEHMMFRDELKEWARQAEIIDVYEYGGERTGLVSNFIEYTHILGDEIVLMCGPPAMFKPAVKNLMKRGITPDNIFISLERRMKCGIGTCGHCIIDGQLYACTHGPVFQYSKCERAASSNSNG
ncbi:MAG TPA: hypothetical protein ENG06_02385 [Thermoplasmatales archaeon]|nr:hypothetical protein [Thermoplasmatales archaeon]